MGLTVKRIARLTDPGRYFDQHGLYLQVLSPTNRSWLLRYQHDGRERWMGLGSLKNFNLEEARERARKARQQLADGVDPIDSRDEERRAQQVARALADARAVTFEQAATQYFEFHQLKWKSDKHRAQFLSSMRDYAYPVLGKLAVAEVDQVLVQKALDPIWLVIPETASRVRQRIEAVLNFAKVRGWRDGENPARWKGHLDHVLPARTLIRKVVHHRALPFAEVAEFMRLLRLREGTAARALEFVVLTAARTSEVTGATWAEIDLNEGIWTVPAERMKAGREHRVPLSAAALAILRGLPREDGNEFVFVGPRANGLSNMSMEMVLRRMGYKEKATTHGFRSTFRDWVSEATSYPDVLAESALAHLTGDKVELSYKRGDVLIKRRKMMETWAVFCGKSRSEFHNIREFSEYSGAKSKVGSKKV